MRYRSFLPVILMFAVACKGKDDNGRSASEAYTDRDFSLAKNSVILEEILFIKNEKTIDTLTYLHIDILNKKAVGFVKDSLPVGIEVSGSITDDEDGSLVITYTDLQLSKYKKAFVERSGSRNTASITLYPGDKPGIESEEKRSQAEKTFTYSNYDTYLAGSAGCGRIFQMFYIDKRWTTSQDFVERFEEKYKLMKRVLKERTGPAYFRQVIADSDTLIVRERVF
jgi:hypothetical protein